MLPGAPVASLIRSRYSGAVILAIGPNSVTLAPPGVEPPGAPSVKSQTLPSDSAASDQGPAAALASARLAKFSMRQKSGPGGSSYTYFSASGLILRGGGVWALADGMNTGVNTDTKQASRAAAANFIGSPLA